jgi:hypothetical protein
LENCYEIAGEFLKIVRELLKILGNYWKILGILENCWKLLAIAENRWKSPDNCWESLEIIFCVIIIR